MCDIIDRVVLPASFIFLAIGIRLASGYAYARAVVKGQAKPNPISWFFWALTATVVFVAQLFSQAGWSAAMSLAVGVGPLVIFLLSLKHNWSRAHFTPASITCAAFAAVGIILWQLTKDPVLAVVCSILADFFSAIPTLTKTYLKPHSEVATPYLLSMVSMAVSLLTLDNWTIMNCAYLLYMFLINAVIFGLVYFEIGQRRQRELTYEDA